MPQTKINSFPYKFNFKMNTKHSIKKGYSANVVLILIPVLAAIFLTIALYLENRNNLNILDILSISVTPILLLILFISGHLNNKNKSIDIYPDHLEVPLKRYWSKDKTIKINFNLITEITLYEHQKIPLTIAISFKDEQGNFSNWSISLSMIAGPHFDELFETLISNTSLSLIDSPPSRTGINQTYK